MFLAALILAFVLGYSTVAPDRRTLTVTRGLRGAVRAVAARSKTGKEASRRYSILRGAPRQSRPGPAKKAGTAAKKSHTNPFYGLASVVRTARAGWRQGVDEALALRESGGDLFSRLDRGPVGQGIRKTVKVGGHVWGSARGWWTDRRTAPPAEHRATAADRARRQAFGGDGIDTGVVFTRDEVGDRVFPAGDDGRLGADPDLSNVIELSPDEWAEQTEPPHPWAEASKHVQNRLADSDGVPGHDAWMDLLAGMSGNRKTDTTNTAEKKGKTMETTDLENLDAVRAEVAAAREAATVMAEQLADMQTWAATLTDRWSGTSWSTDGLNSAIANTADAVPQIDPEALLSALAAIEDAANEATALAEVADQLGARGDLAAFRAS